MRLLPLLLAISASAAPPELVTVSARQGVDVPFALFTPGEKPAAAAVLFSGGPGVINVANYRKPKWGKNFLVRTRDLFTERGVAVAIVEKPSDRDLLAGPFRMGADHAKDVAAVIAEMRKRFGVPVWVVGTSMGTLSAAAVASRLAPPEGPDGVALTSTVTDSPKGDIGGVSLNKIRVPTLVLHHKHDDCKHCAPASVPAILGGLKNAPKSELVWVDGGTSDGDYCEPFAHHGYAGVEEEAVTKIVDWIKANSKKAD